MGCSCKGLNMISCLSENPSPNLKKKSKYVSEISAEAADVYQLSLEELLNTG